MKVSKYMKKKRLSKTQKIIVGIVAVVLIGGVAYGLYHKTDTFDNGSSTTQTQSPESSSNSSNSSSSSSNSSDKKSSSITANADWITIGTQTWAKANLNVGTMVTGATAQTDNSVIEKYCYDNLESNCTTYGGLYQWDEAMQYVNTQGAQGICPTGSHIPSDNDWKILEVQLGMTQVQADTTGWHGTDQGTQLKHGGTSGLNMLLAGNRNTAGSFYGLSSYANLWSSSESSTSAWHRYLYTSYATVNRSTYVKSNGFSVRCIGN